MPTSQQQRGKQPNLKMDKALEDTFLQRYTNAQQAHEKVLNIISYEGNANQNYTEIPLYTY